MSATYRYALNNAGTVVDVLTMSRNNRNDGAPFTCVGCSALMIPALGPKNIWHFRHHLVPPCPNETYLHRLAKQVFADTYRKAVEERTPFYLIREVGAVCTHFKQRFGYACKRPLEDKHDLTRYFKAVGIEEAVDDFRADVLLSSPSGKEVLLIEFVVTHRCESQKIASGKRIIEVQIRDEEDIELLKYPIITGGANIIVYNFSSQQQVGDICHGNCNRLIHVFAVRRSQKAILLEVEASEVEKKWQGPYVAPYYEVLGLVKGAVEDKAQLFRRKVREAHFAGAKIRNCYLCRYHGGSYDAPVFCRVDKKNYESNQAVDCDAYRPLSSMAACEAADKTNDDYLRQRDAQRQQWQAKPKETSRTQSIDITPSVDPNWPDPWSIWKGRQAAEGTEEEPAVSAPLLTCIFCGKQTDNYWSSNQASGTCSCRECYRAGRY